MNTRQFKEMIAAIDPDTHPFIQVNVGDAEDEPAVTDVHTRSPENNLVTIEVAQ